MSLVKENVSGATARRQQAEEREQVAGAGSLREVSRSEPFRRNSGRETTGSAYEPCKNIWLRCYPASRENECTQKKRRYQNRMGNSHSQSRPVLLSRTPVERPFAQPSNRVLPTAETPRLRPTDNGSILHNGGTLRRRAHSEPELSTLDREPSEEEEAQPRGPAAALAPSQARIRSRKKARAPQPPRRPLPPLPAADGRYEKHRAKSLDRLPREALCEAIEEAARKRRNSSFKMSLQHPAERGYPPERGQAHSVERGKMHSAERGQMYSVERGQGYTVEKGQVHHSSDRGHRTEREKVHSAGPPADRGLFFSAERTRMLQELRSRTERVPPHSTERSQTYSTENLQGHSNERGQAHSVERSQTHSVERSRAHSVERSRAHSVERSQTHSVERSQAHSVERSQMHSVEHSTNRRSDYNNERGNAYPAERGRVQSKERGKFHPGERRKVYAAERTRAQSSERLKMYPPEILQTQLSDRERVRPAAQWSSSSSLSGSEEELEIDLQLRPTLPRRLVEVSRFSPTDVWKSINLDFFKAHQTRSDPSSEDELLEEQRIRRVSRPVAPRRPAAASAADSGISEPPWVPQQDLPAEEESESGGSEPAPPGRGPPTFTLMFPSRSLPRPPQAEPPSRSSRPRGLRRALGLRERGSGKEVERRLDPNWSLSRSLPNVVYLPGERRFAYPGGAERGRFAFQSTARREERAAMEAALAAEAAGRERRRQQEIDWMNRVEEEFRKQRDKEKQGIRLQLRALQETTTGMKKWLKRSPRPDPEGGRSEGEDCNELYNSRNKSNIDDNFKCGISNENYDLSMEVSQRENKAPNKKNYSPPKNEDEKPVSRRKVGRELNSFSRNHPHRGRLQQRILSC